MRSLIVVAAGCWLLAAPALAQDEARARVGEDQFVTGEQADLATPAAGDAFLAGGRSAVRAPVAGDAVVTGGEVDITGPVQQDVYAAGGVVRIDAPVAGGLRVAGGTVTVGPKAEVRGNTTIAGGSVRIEGRLDRDLAVYGGSLVLDGHVGGDVEVASNDVRLGPNARVDGRLVHRGTQPPQVDPAAVVTGGIVGGHGMHGQHWTWDWDSGPARVLGFIGGLVWYTGLVVLGALLVLVFPGFTREAAALARREAPVAMLLGFAILVAVPVAILISFVTIIGIPLGLAGLFGYGLLVMLGYLTGALALGDWLLERAAPARAGSGLARIALLLVALVALALLARLPWVGGLAVFLVFLAGLGAWTLRFWRGHTRTV